MFACRLPREPIRWNEKDTDLTGRNGKSANLNAALRLIRV